ncbi:MAG: hypothetical protein WCP41_01705 [Verrucomicrobiota bacterium]
MLPLQAKRFGTHHENSLQRAKQLVGSPLGSLLQNVHRGEGMLGIERGGYG